MSMNVSTTTPVNQTNVVDKTASNTASATVSNKNTKKTASASVANSSSTTAANTNITTKAGNTSSKPVTSYGNSSSTTVYATVPDVVKSTSQIIDVSASSTFDSNYCPEAHCGVTLDMSGSVTPTSSTQGLTEYGRFMANMNEVFGFDAYTSSLMYELYVGIQENYGDVANYKFLSAMASCIYEGIQWEVTVGVLDGKENTIEFMVDNGLTEDEAGKLYQEIRYQYRLSGYTGSYENLKEKYKANHKEYEARFFMYYGKSDFAHMCATLSTYLYPRSEVNKMVSNYAGEFSGVATDIEKAAGYMGDIYGKKTIGNDEKTSLGQDDYKADLDAVNLAQRLKYNDDLLGVMYEYYNGIEKGSINRAREFLNNIGEEQFMYEMSVNTIGFKGYEVRNDFVTSVIAGSNELITTWVTMEE